MKTLITFGDSWPQGGELKHPDKPYGNLLQKKLDFDQFFNYGSAGASNEDTVLQLIDYIENTHQPTNSVTAIFFLTNPARSMHWPRGMSWNWASEERKHWPSDALDTIKELFLHFHDNNRDAIRSNMSVTSCQQICLSLGFNDYYFAGWVRYDQWLPGVNTYKIYKAGKETAADWFGATDHNGEHLLNVSDNQYIRPNFAHPNKLGHEIIAEKLAKWINQ